MEAIREIIFKPAWYWIIVIVPTVLTYIGAVPENERGKIMNQLFDFFPSWIWLTFSYLAFIATLLVSTYKYVKKKEEEYKREIEKYKNTLSAVQSADQAVGVGRDVVNSTIHQGDVINNLPNLKDDDSPNVEIKDACIKLGKFNFYTTNRYGEIFDDLPVDTTFFEVLFSNNPLKRSAEGTSSDVRAEIDYYEFDDTKIGSIAGGWMDLDSLRVSKTVALSFNGDARILPVGVRFLDESPLFMHGMETDPEYFGVRDRNFKYRLSEGEAKDIKVKIHLLGERLDKEYNLILHYAGKGAKSSIEVLK